MIPVSQEVYLGRIFDEAYIISMRFTKASCCIHAYQGSLISWRCHLKRLQYFGPVMFPLQEN